MSGGYFAIGAFGVWIPIGFMAWVFGVLLEIKGFLGLTLSILSGLGIFTLFVICLVKLKIID
jgi:hypothetical protein